MNIRMVAYVLGRIFLVEAGLMLLPLGCAALYGEATLAAFLVPIGVLVALGCALGLRRPKNTVIYARDGLVVAALAWVFSCCQAGSSTFLAVSTRNPSMP